MGLRSFLNLMESAFAERKDLKVLPVEVHSKKQNCIPMVQGKIIYQRDYFQACEQGLQNQPAVLHHWLLAAEGGSSVIRA